MVGQPGQGNRPQDTPIAAIALQHEWTLVTNTTDAFSLNPEMGNHGIL
jgi:predicted nucleic acid-binding protein